MLRLSKKVGKKIIRCVFAENRTVDENYGWFGHYNSWLEASKECSGYSSSLILEKVRQSMLKVKNGEAVYERDSVLFDKVEYSWPLLTYLLFIATKSGNKLHVLDFGGSLGSSYFQNRMFLSHLFEFTWNIVEQPHFVKCGQLEFQDDTLYFYNSINEYFENRNEKLNVIILSSVLQYLEHPDKIVNEIIKYKIDYIIVDLTPFTTDMNNRITVQRVWPEIYEASYPCTFFNETMFLSMFEPYYYNIASFNVSQKSNLDNTYYKGFIFKYYD